MSVPQGRTARPARAVVPRATYRLQLHAGFGFADATALVPYLAALGISHLYISPPLSARPGSTHGYDVVDHNTLNPELGTEADFEAMVEALHAHSMGLVVDIVPNHMGVLGGDNAWWLDVLENGAASAYAEHFDIDWGAADPALTGKVLLPILGDAYGIVLERGELQLGFDASQGHFTLCYFEHRLPIDPRCGGRLLRAALERLQRGAAEDVPAADRADDRRAGWSALAQALEDLPAHDDHDTEHRRRRQREKSLLKRQLARDAQADPAFAKALQQVIDELNGSAGDAASFDALSALIDLQPYRLAFWRVAADEINYRRFFDVNELAALRMENDAVFEDTHRLILALAARGAIDGLRIDHPDGLADPAAYFDQLQRRYAEAAGLPPPQLGQPGAPLPLYVVVEKIVATHEEVPVEWAVHGTTGYRFANLVNGVLIDAAAKSRLGRAWRAFAGDAALDFDTLDREGRLTVMDASLAGELAVLSNALLRLARADRRTRDFTLRLLRQALAEVIAEFPVYRTYIVDAPSAQDRKFIDWAVGRARRRSRAADASVFDFIHRVLLADPLAGAPAGLAQRYLTFARRVQQYSAPVAAKGVEDTALYRHHRLVSVNDVGGDPDEFGTSVAAFHAASRDRSRRWPGTMLATSTHDAKRSEDVRARIDVISELPAAWRLATRRWARMNRRHKREVDGAPAPSANDEYLLYQLIAGSLPPAGADAAEFATHADRVEQAMLKSVREAKVHSSWQNPNADYEAALSAFVHALLDRREGNAFVADLQPNIDRIAWFGALNGLTLALIKALSPGVPDYYQGHEALELSLVDPDNRRPVDYARRRDWLAQSQRLAAASAASERSATLREWLAAAPDGRAKFWVSWRALQLRRELDAWLPQSDYLPIKVQGSRARHVIAFARRDAARWLVVVATRLHAGLGGAEWSAPLAVDWGDTALVWPGGDGGNGADGQAWLEDAIAGGRHAVSGGLLRLDGLLREFPVAALFGARTGADETSGRERAGADRDLRS